MRHTMPRTLALASLAILGAALFAVALAPTAAACVVVSDSCLHTEKLVSDGQVCLEQNGQTPDSTWTCATVGASSTWVCATQFHPDGSESICPVRLLEPGRTVGVLCVGSTYDPHGWFCVVHS
ncbi:MAG TPA: hypothetical protein VM241_04495 [Candidatus Thermoplasmatota archaeon]|nr:hypothetical protein [Candidatus Thermoplasmatota archaeon]